MTKTILVIEDEVPLADAIAKKLAIDGFEVQRARSLEEGRTKLNQSISAIWLDHYLLGKGTGLDFVAQVKGEPELKKIPIFVVSNTAGPDKIKSYLALGVNKYYTKSDFKLQDIINDIHSALAERGDLVK